MGGKSRKTGGISKALIDRIKNSGNAPQPKKDSGSKTPRKGLFSDDEEE